MSFMFLTFLPFEFRYLIFVKGGGFYPEEDCTHIDAMLPQIEPKLMIQGGWKPDHSPEGHDPPKTTTNFNDFQLNAQK